MKQHRYDPFTQSLHWITALAIIAAYVIGLGRKALPKGDLHTFLIGLHMSIGTLVLGLTMAHIGWRSFVPAPLPLPSTEGAHEVSAHAMMLLAGLHAAAAIAHQTVFKDGMLARMLPAGRFNGTARKSEMKPQL